MTYLHDRAHDCISDLLLDRMCAGETVSPHVRAHVDACEPCRDRLAAIERETARFRQAELPPWLEARPRRTCVRPLVAAASLLAAVTLLWLVRGPVPGERADDAIRLKGGGALTVYVRQAERTFVAAPGTRVHPGDALRIALSTPEPAWVAVLGRDATGQWSTYHPLGDLAEPLSAGSEQLLDMALELDAELGEETFVAVFCTGPTDVEAIRSATMETFPILAYPPGCHAASLTLEKTP